jgi:autotransporter-associated beta strand protein
VADRFFDLDTANFGDTFGPANTPVTNSTITLSTTVMPLAVNVNNSAVNYSITGGGKISGGATLTKSGTGTLTLQTNNDFTGASNLQAGAVDIGNATGALGTGSLTLGGAKLLVANSASAGLTNSGLAVTGNATIQADGATAPLALPALSGNGTLTLTTTVQDKLIDIGANSSFTGNLNIGADGVTATAMGVRFNGASSGLPNSVVTLSNGGSIRDRATSVQTIEIGALVGDATSVVQGYQGGLGATAKTWRIGALNTSTTFAGTIIDGAGSSSTTAATNITKVGTGTLTLTGANTYTGDTSVEAGTLSIANPYLADTADVLVSNGATLNLNFAGTDTIDSLFFAGISQAIGTWGAVGSGAMFTSPLITGTGLLQVTTHAITPIAGDFDGNGTVDSADLAKWRADVLTGTGSDANGDGRTDGADFLIWQRNLGLSSSAAAAAGAVPEPATAMLVVGALLVGSLAPRRGGLRLLQN